MEDILASIRRIIADDQVQSTRPVNGGLRRVIQGDTPGHAAADDRVPRHSVSIQEPIDDTEVLDLARMPDAVVLGTNGHDVLTDREPRPSAPTTGYQAEAAIVPTGRMASQPYASAYVDVSAGIPTGGEGGRSDHEGAYLAEQPETAPTRAPDPRGYDQHDAADGLISPVLGASVMSSFEALAATVVLQNTEMLDRVMHDLMRPLLKTWLDENLPSLVERLVRIEIERVARGNRA